MKPKKQRPLEHFLIQFGIMKFESGSNVLFVDDNKYFLITQEIANIIKKTKKPFYAGIYIGKSRGKKFFPSVNLLNMISKKSSNKVWVDKKTEWLFVCGRDIFSSGIKKATPNINNVKVALVLNMTNEVIGFGKIMKNIREKGAVIMNISDVGDFLRREKK